MQIRNSRALVTGASRGIGRALVDALLERGTGRVYAAARDLSTLEAVARQRLDSAWRQDHKAVEKQFASM